MEHVLSWLNRPVPPGPSIRIWMVLSGVLVLLALAGVFTVLGRKKKHRPGAEMPDMLLPLKWAAMY